MKVYHPKINLTSSLEFCLSALLFLLPWQTVLIVQERFVNGAKLEYGTTAFYGSEILLWFSVLLFVWWYGRQIRLLGGEINFSFSLDRLFAFSVLVFVLYAFVGSFWAGDQELGFQQSFRLLEAFLLFFLLYLGPLNFYRAGSWFVGGAAVVSALGIWQFLTQSTFAFKWLGLVEHEAHQAGTSIVSSDSSGRWLRAYGSFAHPNIFGGYLVLGIMTSAILWLKSKTEKVGFQAWLLISFILQAAALFFSFSRSAWLAGFLILIFYFYLSGSRHRYSLYEWTPVLVGGLMMGITAILFLSPLQSRLQGESSYELWSVTERQLGYRTAQTIINDNFWFGVGAGNYGLALYNHDNTLPGAMYQPVHNVFLLLMAELGFVGVVLFAIVVGIFLRLQVIFFKIDWQAVVLFGLCLLPPVLLDHYIYTTFPGLLLVAVALGLFLRIYPRSLHK